MKASAAVMGLLLAGLLGIGSAHAEPINDTNARVTINVPEGWTHKPVNGALSIDEPNKQVNFTIVMVEAPDLKQAAARAASMLKKLTTKLKLDKGRKLSLGGMAGMGFKGSAVLGPKPITIALLVAITPTNKGMLVIGLAETAKFKAHKKTVETFLASIVPLKK